MFLVDATDRDRFSESKKELDGLLSEDALSKVRERGKKKEEKKRNEKLVM